ncbi:class I SAM-dependent methyltransferase [Amycolatopsis magusensis]|uniref:Ubiquinone/menaquinone biosynthesis C-methylase UbiE n=1 Tax=Amycolatopsis magusensis TaxID=882444 RepID=A0ABS4PY88_9PSEU|nr:class I SAM-dependent methyltransferase [Amycolatopsis magusensis]MBP2184399.1 ubiquinone/menaquinone biosynthesis C-methylase UbiE [Amycolatopsis magusensis]MDI5975692.1 class I SAM-dependent methyltransferase [Amycolatopsis magusensis]
MKANTSQQKDLIAGIYHRIAGEYDERIPGFTALDATFSDTEISFVLDRVTADDEVLDIGCGTGRITIPVAHRAKAVTGFDLTEAMLEQAARKAAEANLDVRFEQGDMAALPFPDDSFDAVVSMLALMHVPPADHPRVFSEVRRVLRPGGRLIIGVKNSVFERFSSADRFATVDITDVENKELVFTGTREGDELRAPWHSFSPDDLKRLTAVAGLVPVSLRGNIPLSAWLADSVLETAEVAGAVRTLETLLGDLPPLNHLGYHLLMEAVKPAVHS